MQMLNIPIVIAAYNRKEPLKRLLFSLNNAIYPPNVKLIISIDGGVSKSEIVDIANRFEWKHGEKQVINSEQNMGLRKHILKCGQLAKLYDGIVLLEDDLYVSPYFYTYVLQAQEVYGNVRDVTGVALYSHHYNETACLPFKPLDDGYDVFFMQVACSWGQSWLKHQWEPFEDWYNRNINIELSGDAGVPPDVRLWPKTSWKKYYLKYMIENNKYFVYPRISLATNFADPGVNHTGSKIFQVPLLYGEKEYRLPEFSKSVSKYDAYCEIAPASLAGLLKEFSDCDFEVDLYGMKNKKEIASDYVVTTQALTECIKSFGRNLKPHELNVSEDISGDEIKFGLKNDMSDYGAFLKYRNKVNQDYNKTHAYFYSITKEHYQKTAQQKQVSFLIRLYNKIVRELINLRP